MSLISKDNSNILLQGIKKLLDLKANKSEVMQSDWNQNDSTSPSYIKNRICYEEQNLIDITGAEYSVPVSSTTYDAYIGAPLELGQVWNVWHDSSGSGNMGLNYENLEVQEDADGNLYLGDLNMTAIPFYVKGGKIYFNKSFIRAIQPSTVKLVCVSGYVTGEPIVKKIDEKYLPDSVIVQPDWNQNDESENDYIKNRPFYEAIEDVVVVPEQTITFENGHVNFEYNEVENMWNTGIDYTVIFDGISYNGTTYEDVDVCIRTDFVTNDGYNVYVYDYNGLTASGMTGEHTIQIILNMPVVHKIDEKFLPDTVATNDELARQTGIKMNKLDPNGTGTFSMNRAKDTIVGNYSSAIGRNTMATSQSQFVFGEYNDNINVTYVEKVEGAVGNSFLLKKGTAVFLSKNYTFDNTTGEFTLENPLTETVPFAAGDYKNYYMSTSNPSKDIRLLNGSAMNSGSATTGPTTTTYYYIYKKCSPMYVAHNRGNYLAIAGNGTSDTERSNAHTLDWSGNAWYQGEVYVGGTGQDDENAKMLATQEYVDNTIPDETDALNLLMEEGFVEPLADVDGTIYTTPDGDIYTLD